MLFAVLVLVILWCVAFVVAQDRGPTTWEGEVATGQGPLVRDRAVRINNATIKGPGADIVIDFVGGPVGDLLTDPCAADYELDVDTTTMPLSMTLWELDPTVRPKPVGLPAGVLHGCNDIGHGRSVRHPSPDHVATEIFDAAHGETIPVVSLAELLSPAVLPNGWTAHDWQPAFAPATRSLSISFGDSTNVSLGATLVTNPDRALQAFRSGSSEPRPAAVRGAEANPTATPLPAPITATVEELTIRDGTPALFETTSEQQRILRFVDGSYLYTLSAHGRIATMPVMLAIAEGLE